MDSRTVRQHQDWRHVVQDGVAIIVKELNDAIDGLELGTLSWVPEQNALDFWFGERVFRIVLKPESVWTPFNRVEYQQVVFVLVRRAIHKPIGLTARATS